MARSSLREFQERLARRLAEAAGSERRGLLTADVALFRTGEVRQVAFDVHSARL